MVPRLLAREGPLWVVEKPAGLPVHPAGAQVQDDLLSWTRRAPELPDDLAPCHRLDRPTSGLVILSADRATRAEVGRWFAEGQVAKAYLALAHGRLHRKGVIRRPLQDARRRRPLPAVTRYRALEGFRSTTLLRVRPETGRKHQIRRHLHGLGHPIVGDLRYRSRRVRAVPGFPGRLWLHCAVLTLPDGRRFESPLPPELEEHVARLRAAATTPAGEI